jgi:uncharacterized Zn-binding protein involved in type VI secretion
MPMPAAMLTSMHVCPQVTVIIPHVGGPVISSGAPTVKYSSLPAVCLGDTAVCVGPPDKVIKGSSTVMVNNKPAARMTDQAAHGGLIVLGFPTILIAE